MTRIKTPRIIHQTWKDYTVPKPLSEYRKRWLKMYPSYEHRLYSDADLRAEVAKAFPQYLQFYDNLSIPIEKVDFARYVLLYTYGGIYADLDTKPLKSIEPLLDTEKVVLSSEPIEHAEKEYGRKTVICNALMISPRSNKEGDVAQFWHGLLGHIIRNYRPNYKPVYTTGPMALTAFIKEPKSVSPPIKLIPACAFFPLTNEQYSDKEQTITVAAGDGDADKETYKHVSRECDLNEAYAVHVWENTWCTPWYLDPRWRNKRYWCTAILVLVIVVFIVFRLRR